MDEKSNLLPGIEINRGRAAPLDHFLPAYAARLPAATAAGDEPQASGKDKGSRARAPARAGLSPAGKAGERGGGPREAP